MNPLPPVPIDMDSVVKRWFPAGVDAIAAARSWVPAGVYVTGTSGSGVTAVASELDLLADEPLPRAPDPTSAAVVLFVFDASAPLGRRALADLAPVLESTTVGMLVNKVDVHRDWREVVRVVSEALDELVPRAIDVVLLPTSAKLAERARAAIDPNMQSALTRESGLTEVLQFVHARRAQPDELLRERQYTAAVRAAVFGARREIVDKARTVTSASATVGLRAERARLSDVRDRTRAERASSLRSRLQLARAETQHDIHECIREFGVEARHSIDAANRAQSKHLHEHLRARLDDAAARVDSALTDRLRSIDTDLELSAELPPSPPLAPGHHPPAPQRRGVEDKMMVVVGASAGVGLGRIAVSPLSMVPILDIATIPVSFVLGALCAWWLVGSRRLVADRAHMRAWVSETVDAVRSALEQRASARMIAAETTFAAAAHETSRSAAAAAETELERVEAELRSAAEHRAAVLAACDRDLVTLDRGLEKFGTLLAAAGMTQ